MKVSLSKFYQEVTGTTTATRTTTGAALKRWGIPFDEAAAKSDAVDVAHLADAKAKHAEEVAAKAMKQAAKPRPTVAREEWDALVERVEAIAQAVGRIEAAVAKLSKALA
jgi:hypothetical protein